MGNYKNNYDIATKTAQWDLTPKQLNLVFVFVGLVNDDDVVAVIRFDPRNLPLTSFQVWSKSGQK